MKGLLSTGPTPSSCLGCTKTQMHLFKESIVSEMQHMNKHPFSSYLIFILVPEIACKFCAIDSCGVTGVMVAQ